MNAAQTFQRLMDRLFGHFPFLFTYLDDHLIASRTLEEHMDHLSQFFSVLQDNGLTINPAKCTFAATSVKFLGHMVSETGLIPLPRHVAAVENFPPPQDLKQLQRFLGLINFYRRFLPSVAQTLKPLTDLLRGNPKALDWSPAADAAFKAAKAALVAAVPLSHPAPNATLALTVDASDSHVGGGSPAAPGTIMAATGLLFKKAFANTTAVFDFRPRTPGSFFSGKTFSVSP
jgi:hypothetical protein